MRENTDQKNSKYGYFLQSAFNARSSLKDHTHLNKPAAETCSFLKYECPVNEHQHCKKYCNFTWFNGVETLRKATVSAIRKLCLSASVKRLNI